METDHQITCSRKEVEKIEKIARSRTAGIWRIKRAKIIMGTLERKTVDRLVLDVRVPPRSIEKCQEKYAKEGLKYFEKPDRRPTQREAAVERMLAFLEEPPHPGSRQWNSLAVHYIGRDLTARQIRKIRDLIASNQEYSRTEIAHQVCLMFGLYQYDGKPRNTAAGVILKRMDMDNIIMLVVGNVRFLIVPWIESRNLASRILGGITRQLPLDWEARYGFRPNTRE